MFDQLLCNAAAARLASKGLDAMTPDEVRAQALPLMKAAGALGVLAAAMRLAHAGPDDVSGSIQTAMDEVLAAAGIPALPPGIRNAAYGPLLGEIQMTLLQSAKLCLDGDLSAGWTHVEPELLLSQGLTSAGFPAMFKQRLVPQLADLGERLDAPGAAFLDVGVGVGALAMAMASLWPELQVVGVDPWQPSLDLAQAGVAESGLASRITLRRQRVQDMPDVRAFDAAWFSGPFVAADELAPALDTLLRALKPGGWVLFGLLNEQGDALFGALARLRVLLWGGRPMSQAEAVAHLEHAGFTEVRAVPPQPEAMPALVVGQRPFQS